MTTQDSRQKSRRRLERRFDERRQIHYPFGSPQWINAIKRDHLLWPKQDRRTGSRRAQERRHLYRRANSDTVNKIRLNNLLSKEEKQLLNDILQLK